MRFANASSFIYYYIHFKIHWDDIDYKNSL